MPAFAANGVNTPSLGGVDADMVRTNNQSTVVDPEGDLNSGDAACLPVLNYGFDYGQIYVYLDPAGDLYWVIETHGNIGDADGDGGYDTESATCGGRPGCVITEGDVADNVFAANAEAVRIFIDRDCDGATDLVFRLTGNLVTGQDELVVEQDDFNIPNINTVIGIQGTGWTGAPIQQTADNPAACVADRNGAILIRIPDWDSYFTDQAGAFYDGTNPCTFEWLVDSGNGSDSYNEDVVEGPFSVCAPDIDIEKSFSIDTLCETGDTTRVTLVVTNTGNTVLENVEIVDPLPAGLVYDNAFIDDPVHPIGAPSPTDPTTWSGITMQPGEVITVSFRVVTDDCVGEPENIAVVSGQFASDCINGGEPAGVADIDTAYVSCAAPDIEIVCLGPITACAGSETSASFRIYNHGSFEATVDYECTADGAPAGSSSVVIAPGDSADIQSDFDMPDQCGEPIEVTCSATIRGDCSDSDEATCLAYCVEPCVNPVAPDTLRACALAEVDVCFKVYNCGEGVQDFDFSGTFSGNPVAVDPTSAADVDPGDSVTVCMTVIVPVDCNPEGFAAVLTATGYVDGDAECSDTQQATAYVLCDEPSVDIVKDVSPEATASGSTVTLTVTNNGEVVLDPVQVSDCFPAAGIGFDEVQIVGGTCDVDVASVESVGDQTCVTFTDFALDPGESCTIIFEVTCLEFTGEAQPDTARVYAWCDGSYPDGDPAYDEDYGQLTCQTGEACPHTIGFWRQQCAQKGNGSTKVCQEGMYDLVDCILQNTGVIKWQMAGNSTSFVTTAQMMAMSQHDRFLALCAQLQGPRPMTLRDMAEVQYIGLMFNVCVGAITENIVYNGDMTVGEVLDGIEAAINADEIGNNGDDSANIGSWKDYADNINNGLDLAAGDCAEGQGVFTGYGPCGDDAAPVDQGILLPSAAPDVVVAQAYPNPVALGAGVTINYRIPSENSGQQVTLRIFDTTGRLVTTLVQQSQSSGEFQATWNMVNDYGQRVPAGVYFYRLNVGAEVFTQKMMIVQR